jgi:hypothetical protein
MSGTLQRRIQIAPCLEHLADCAVDVANIDALVDCLERAIQSSPPRQQSGPEFSCAHAAAEAKT